MRSYSTLWIGSKTVKELENKAIKAGDFNLREICGVFHVTERREMRLTQLRNKTTQPGKFWLPHSEARHFIAKFTFSGTFHSHPISDARPSLTDRNLISLSRNLLIYSDLRGQLALWRLYQNSAPTMTHIVDRRSVKVNKKVFFRPYCFTLARAMH